MAKAIQQMGRDLDPAIDCPSPKRDENPGSSDFAGWLADEWERSGKEPDQIPEWLESEGGPDGVYRKYLARQRRRLTKNERDMAVHDLSEFRPICKIALPHPLAYLDGDYQAVVHIDAVQQTLEIKAVDPKVTPAWLRANAERLVSSRAMLDMRPTPKEPDIAVDTFMTKPNGGEIRNTAGDSAAAARRFINARDRSGVPFDDDRDRIVRGHPAAEAIFRLKRPITEPTVSDALVRADQSQRRRRVLETLSTAPVRHEAAVENPVSSEPPITPEIQASQFRRVRAWADYGMTVPQIAQTYGVAVGEIKRILRKPRR
jgi:hypothetical protein